MKKISIINPIELKIEDEERHHVGPKYLEHVTDIGVSHGDHTDFTVNMSLHKIGVNLSESETLVFDSLNSEIGGKHIKQVMPSGGEQVGPYTGPSDDDGNVSDIGTNVPRTFYEPYKFSYKFNEEGSKWYGQSNKGAIDYRVLNFKDENAAFGDNLQNPRFISFNNELYLLAERNLRDDKNTQEVVLYVKNEDDEFELVKRFDEIPVDQVGLFEDRKWSQHGSPDACVVEDKLVIVYRFVNRLEGESGRNYIAVYTVDNSMSNWSSQIAEIKNSIGVDYDYLTYAEFDDIDTMNDRGFRLRCAYGGGVITVAYAGRRTVEIDDGNQIFVKKEMGFLQSFDKGTSFEQQDTGYAAFTRSENDYVEEDRFTGLMSYFVPRGAGSVSDNYGSFNVNFALYYDENMASFVILKPGDPDGLQTAKADSASMHLMGAKTVSGDFSTWEPCLDIALTPKNVGNLGIKSKSEYDNRVYDVDVAVGETINDIFLLLGAKNDSVLMTQGEFTFVKNNRFKRGMHRKPYVSMGSKAHRDFIFCTSPLNVYGTGPITIGNESDDPFNFTDRTDWPVFHDLTCCKHQHQLIFSSKTQVPDDEVDWNSLSKFNYYSVSAPISNMTEGLEYTFHYCKDILDISSLGLDAQPSAGLLHDGRFDYFLASDSTGWWNRFDSEDSVSFFRYHNFSEFDESLLLGHNRRVKFDFRLLANIDDGEGYSILFPPQDPIDFDDPDSEDDFQQTILSIGDLQLRIHPPNGRLDVYDAEENSLLANVFDGEDWNNVYEIVLAIDRPVGSFDDVVCIWWRRDGEDWNYMNDGEFNLGEIDIPDDQGFDIGFVDRNDTDSGDQYAIGIGNVQFGVVSHENTFEPVFTSSRGLHDLEGNDGVLSNASMSFKGNGNADPIEVYDKEFQLIDGTVVSLNDTTLPSKSVFELWNMDGKNSVSNLTDGFADSTFDFTFKDDLTVLYENVDRKVVDSFAFVNIHGVHSVDIEFQDHFTQSYNTIYQESFNVPYEVLEFDEYAIPNTSQHLHVEDELSVGDLIGKSIIFYNTETDIVESHFMVLKNGENNLMLDRPHNYNSDYEIRLMSDSFAVNLSEVPNLTTHIEFTFNFPSDRERSSAGQFVAGRLVDLHRYITSFDRDGETSFGIEESDFGRAFPSMFHSGNFYEEAELLFDDLDTRNYKKILNLVNGLYKLNKPFVIDIDGPNEKETLMAVLTDSWSIGPSSMFFDVDIPVILQRWNPLAGRNVDEPIYFDFEIFASPQQYIDEEIEFTIDIDNPSGQALSATWDFGDGEVEEQGEGGVSGVSHTYEGVGEYVVQCLVRGENRSVLRTLLVEVIERPVVKISLESDGGLASSDGGNGLTVSSIKANDEVYENDNYTKFEFAILDKQVYGGGFDTSEEEDYEFTLSDDGPPIYSKVGARSKKGKSATLMRNRYDGGFDIRVEDDRGFNDEMFLDSSGKYDNDVENISNVENDQITFSNFTYDTVQGARILENIDEDRFSLFISGHESDGSSFFGCFHVDDQGVGIDEWVVEQDDMEAEENSVNYQDADLDMLSTYFHGPDYILDDIFPDRILYIPISTDSSDDSSVLFVCKQENGDILSSELFFDDNFIAFDSYADGEEFRRVLDTDSEQAHATDGSDVLSISFKDRGVDEFAFLQVGISISEPFEQLVTLKNAFAISNDVGDVSITYFDSEEVLNDLNPVYMERIYPNTFGVLTEGADFIHYKITENGIKELNKFSVEDGSYMFTVDNTGSGLYTVMEAGRNYAIYKFNIFDGRFLFTTVGTFAYNNEILDIYVGSNGEIVTIDDDGWFKIIKQQLT